MATGKGPTYGTWTTHLSDSLDLGVLITDSAGEVEFANRRLRDLFSCADEKQLAAAWHALQRAIGLAAGRPFGALEDGTALRVTLDGEVGDLRLRVEIHLLDGDACAGRLLLIHDLDGIEELREHLKLGIRYRHLTRALPMLVHDLKAPLNALALNLELIRTEFLRSAPGDAGKRGLEAIDAMNAEFQRLGRLLGESLLQYRDPASTPRRFDLGRAIVRFADLIHPLCREQRVRLDLIAPPRRTYCAGDPDRLKQALINVAMNALEAMEKGGTLSLRGYSRGDRVVIEVADTGPGIPEDRIARIFDLSFTTKEDGSGVGLFVARALVADLGGTIQARNLQKRDSGGAGCVFTIDLPAATPEGSSAEWNP